MLKAVYDWAAESDGVCLYFLPRWGQREQACMFFFLYVSVFVAWMTHRGRKWGRKTCPSIRAGHIMKQGFFFFFSFSLLLVSTKIIPLLLKWKAVAEGWFCVLSIHFRKWIAAYTPALCSWAELLIYGPVFLSKWSCSTLLTDAAKWGRNY